MSTRCVRYIQSCISPASQSVSQAHTPSRPFTCAHAAQRRAVGLRDAASVQGEGSGLLGPFPSTSDERGPSAQGPFTLSHTHSHTHTHTYTPQVTSEVCSCLFVVGEVLLYRPYLRLLMWDVFIIPIGWVWFCWKDTPGSFSEVCSERVRFRWSCFETQ